MFIYLLTIAATLFITFGLVHARCLNDWVQSSIRCSMSAYHGLIRRPTIEASLSHEDLEIPEPSMTMSVERPEYEDFLMQRTAFSDGERSLDDILRETAGLDAILTETRGLARSLNAQRFSFETILSDEKDDLGLPGIKNQQLGTTQEDTIRTSKQEARENIFESLKSSIEKTTAIPTSRLNTSQIYNLILKETLKENAAKQKLIETARNNFESTTKTEDHFPSSSEDSPERDGDDATKSSKSNLLNIDM